MTSIGARYIKTHEPRRAAELRRLPQRRISVYELLLYAALPFLLAMTGAMPTASLFLLPFELSILFLLYRRFGIYFPAAVIVGYGAAALGINYDILTVIYSLTLFFGLMGVVTAVQFSHHLALAAIAAAVTVVGALAGAGVVRLAEGESVGDIAAHYVAAEAEDPIVKFLAEDYYEGNVEDGERLAPSDPGYATAAVDSFAEWAHDEFEQYLWYYCIHFGALFGGAAAIMAVIILRRTASCYDADVTKEELALSTRALGGARAPGPLSDMPMPRSFLWAMVLPAVVTGIVFEIIGGFGFLTSTLMHLLVTLPSAFTCFSLTVYLAELFKGKARGVSYTVAALIGLAAMLFPVALFILSVLGICDCILNLRFWVKFIKED